MLSRGAVTKSSDIKITFQLSFIRCRPADHSNNLFEVRVLGGSLVHMAKHGTFS